MIMFHYLYTNDMRIDSLPEKAYQFATMFLTDSLPSADEDKSLNNNGNANKNKRGETSAYFL